MCLIVFQWQPDSPMPFLVAGNRDEDYARPSNHLGPWKSNPQILAGQDKEQGGTWFGLAKTGRFAGLTNYSERQQVSTGQSRGFWVKEYLGSEIPAQKWLSQNRAAMLKSNGFNLLMMDKSGLFYFSNKKDRLQKLSPGLYALSNAYLDTPWPKVQRIKTLFKTSLNNKVSAESLLSLLTDRHPPKEEDLPNVDMDLERIRARASCFVCDNHYGTRSSAVVLAFADGKTQMHEQTYYQNGVKGEKSQYLWQLPKNWCTAS